jgi:hypothetical protein
MLLNLNVPIHLDVYKPLSAFASLGLFQFVFLFIALPFKKTVSYLQGDQFSSFCFKQTLYINSFKG